MSVWRPHNNANNFVFQFWITLVIHSNFFEGNTGYGRSKNIHRRGLLHLAFLPHSPHSSPSIPSILFWLGILTSHPLGDQPNYSLPLARASQHASASSHFPSSHFPLCRVIYVSLRFGNQMETKHSDTNLLPPFPPTVSFPLLPLITYSLRASSHSCTLI